MLSTSPTAPTVLILGITGSQGSSVAHALLASDKPYHLIGVTRDASKPAALEWKEKGVEIRECTVAVGRESEVRRAMEGVEVVFAMTDSWAHFDFEREVAEGKLLVDASLASGIKLFIWSALESLSSLTQGRYPACSFYETKARITAHLIASGQAYALVQPAAYFSNLINLYKPLPQPDGSYLLSLPSDPKSSMAWLDAPTDFGAYVRAIIENEGMGEGSELLCGSEATWEEVVEVLSRVSGKKVKYTQVGKDEFFKLYEHLGQATPMLYNMFKAFETAGFYGPKSIAQSQKKAGVKARTFAEIAEGWEGPLLS